MGPVSTTFTHTPLRTWNDTDAVVDVFQIPESPAITTVPWLFLRNEHLVNQSADVIYSFILTSKESGNILAVFHCSSPSACWLSPPLAPFGGIIPTADCRKTQLVFLLSCVRDWVNRHGGSRLEIKTAPSCYDSAAHELCHQSYLEAGFLPNHTYSNHYIPIGDHDFSQIIELSERRRLAKGKRSGLQVTTQTGPCCPITEALLNECYLARGYKLSLSPRQLSRFINCTPESYLVLTNWHGAEPIAAAVMVRVSDNVLYHFLSGFLPAFNTLSPSVMLFETAYQFCKDNGIRILDLGISVDHHGNEKPSLARFKKRIGARECEKIIYGTNL